MSWRWRIESTDAGRYAAGRDPGVGCAVTRAYKAHSTPMIL